jgi:hypothetical protein
MLDSPFLAKVRKSIANYDYVVLIRLYNKVNLNHEYKLIN